MLVCDCSHFVEMHHQISNEQDMAKSVGVESIYTLITVYMLYTISVTFYLIKTLLSILLISAITGRNVLLHLISGSQISSL